MAGTFDMVFLLQGWPGAVAAARFGHRFQCGADKHIIPKHLDNDNTCKYYYLLFAKCQPEALKALRPDNLRTSIMEPSAKV